MENILTSFLSLFPLLGDEESNAPAADSTRCPAGHPRLREGYLEGAKSSLANSEASRLHISLDAGFVEEGYKSRNLINAFFSSQIHFAKLYGSRQRG